MTQPNAGTRKYSVPAISVHTSNPSTCKMAEAVEREGENRAEEGSGDREKTIKQNVNKDFLEYICVHMA